MKRLIQCCFVFLCCLLLLPVFSVSANAEEIEKPYHVYEYGYYINNGWNNMNLNFSYNIGDGEIQKKEVNYTASGFPSSNANSIWISRNWKAAITDGSILAESGRKIDIRLENVYMSHLLTDKAQTKVYVFDSIKQANVIITYTDGSTIQIGASVEGQKGNKNKILKTTFTPTKDVKSVEFVIQFDIYNDLKNTSFYHDEEFTITTYVGQWISDLAPTLYVNQASEEVGLLSNIWNGITTGFSNLANSFSDGVSNITSNLSTGFSNLFNGIKDVFNRTGDVVDSVTDLPSKIWTLIENGLKKLFIPDEVFLDDFFAQMESETKLKFGFIAEVPDLLHSLLDFIPQDVEHGGGGGQYNDTVVTIPEVTIPLPENASFTFGGYDVSIVPTGFEFMLTAIKLITGILATCLFLNSMRKRYEGLFN